MARKHLFLSELYPPLIGGSCSMFAGRFRYFNKQKIVVLTKLVPEAEDFDKKQGYPIVRIKMQWRGLKGFEWWGIVQDLFLASISVVRRHRIDTIVCARPLPEGFAGLLLSTFLGKKLIVNYHGEDISVLQNYRVERMLMKWIMQKANLNIANSNYTRELVENLAQKEIKITTIFPGFSPEKLELKPKNNFSHFFTKRPVILTIGRLQKRKGQDHTIKAMPQVLKHFPNAHYLIVGSAHGGNKELYQEMYDLITANNLHNNVTIVGEVEDEDIPYFYQNCDVFIMANRKVNEDIEGFGIVFLEAGYFSKPVIGGKVGGSTDAVLDGKTGYLVDGENIDEIAQKIIDLLANPEKSQKFGKTAKKNLQNLTEQQLSLAYTKKLKQRGLLHEF